MSRKKEDDPTELHRTANLYEGSYLLAKNYELAGVEKQPNSAKVVLVFKGAGVQKTALSFYNAAVIAAKSFSDSYRTLKDLVFQNRR